MSSAQIIEPARRPAVVTAAAAIMISMAAAGLAYAIFGLVGTGGVVDRYRQAAAATGESDDVIDVLANLAWGTVIAAAVLAVIVGLLLTALAFGNLRGSSGARIATWFVSGLGLLCGFFSLLTVLLQAALTWNVSDDRVTEQLTQALTDAYPAWWFALSGMVATGQALGYLVVALLLALPAAHPHFRGRPA
ncbi:hypothetical protein K1W54_01145 [Micromonospora sp. CPCC 205371]|nr:hypothetical protein [Micromonospora sp. CPCC 205371]